MLELTVMAKATTQLSLNDHLSPTYCFSHATEGSDIDPGEVKAELEATCNVSHDSSIKQKSPLLAPAEYPHTLFKFSECKSAGFPV